MIGLLGFIVGFGLSFWFSRGLWWNHRDPTDPNRVALALAGLASLLIGAACWTVGDSVQIVQAGHRVVVFDNIHGVRPKALTEGVNLITPFIQTGIDYDVRVQKVEFDASASSKDLQDVATKVALNFHPDPESVPDIYQHYGSDYQEKVIHPAVQEAVKAVTALYTAEELVTKREDVKRRVQDELAKMMRLAKLNLDQTYITDFKFSDDFSKAIEAKQVAEQSALKAGRDLDRVKLESEQKIAQLRAEAEGLRMQKEQITPQLVQLRAIEKWDGRLPQIIMGGATPMINMDEIIKHRAVKTAGTDSDQ